jgi:octaprenyl-diphosphate synthase
MALVADGMNSVNAVILDRMQSRIPLIPALAGHLIAGGGKRMRPMLTLAGASLLGYGGSPQAGRRGGIHPHRHAAAR